MTLTSSGVVIRGFPDGGLSLLLPGCQKRVMTIMCLFITSKTARHVSNTCTCVKMSKRGISVICDSLDGDLSLLTLNFLRVIAIGTTLFQYRAA